MKIVPSRNFASLVLLLAYSISIPQFVYSQQTNLPSAQATLREVAKEVLENRIIKRLFPDAKVTITGQDKTILNIFSDSITQESAKAFMIAPKADFDNTLFKLGFKTMSITNGVETWNYEVKEEVKLTEEENRFIRSITKGTKESRQKLINEVFLRDIKKTSPDLQVAILDSDCTIIKISSSDCTKHAPMLMNNAKDEFKAFGFKRIIFYDGKAEQSYDLN